MLFAVTGCSSVPVVLIESGVSRELAVSRKENIYPIEYTLFFSIPKEKDSAVIGRSAIKFVKSDKSDIILDFKNDESAVKALFINGNKTKFKFQNEHITIPGRASNKGENIVEIEFVASDQSLNRQEEYLYTLLVPDRARTLFPCFDQPDLKAKFSLSLEIPSGWKGVANANIMETDTLSTNGRVLLNFSQTEPIPTYLFSFVAGKLQKISQVRDGRQISIYHRETDQKKIAQCDTIFSQIFRSLHWLENYTAIDYPFSKYDIIILPGFQYGGMEHMGATLYADKTMFIDENATIGEQLNRAKLIAHETAHMWFGDYVTMEWFNDVWIKEVFANWFASRMIAPLYPGINHKLNFMNTYYPASYSEDRTHGSNPVQQELDNMNNAGLVYGNIIYNKAPIVMDMLVKKIGEENFQKGIRQYLKKFAYSNANWDDLIEILDQLTGEDLISWSNIWVKEKGMPTISSEVAGDSIIVNQRDPFGRGIKWEQPLKFELLGKFAIPNTDGCGYGYFQLDSITSDFIINCLSAYRAGENRELPVLNNDVTRGSLLITLYENLLNGKISPEKFVRSLSGYLPNEENILLYTRALNYLSDTYASYLYKDGPDPELENILWNLAENNKNIQHRTLALRIFTDIANSEYGINKLYSVWLNPDSFHAVKLGERDLIKASYELALRFPQKYTQIKQRQLARISNPDRVKEYLFIFPSLSPNKETRDSVFNSLLKAENREIEPWASTSLSYLNHYLRDIESVGYIKPGLDVLKEIQRTGDIFFPRDWLRALLKGHNSIEAMSSVSDFLSKNKEYPPMLMDKILQQADHLYRLESKTNSNE